MLVGRRRKEIRPSGAEDVVLDVERHLNEDLGGVQRALSTRRRLETGDAVTATRETWTARHSHGRVRQRAELDVLKQAHKFRKPK